MWSEYCEAGIKRALEQNDFDSSQRPEREEWRERKKIRPNEWFGMSAGAKPLSP